MAWRVVAIGEMAADRAAHQATLLPDGRVLVTGGCTGPGCDRVLASVETFDPGTAAFRSAAPMTTPRASHAAVALADGRVLVSGGWTGRGATAGAEIYDPGADRWTTAADMTEARMSHATLALPDGRVLIAGASSAETFDPATDRFSAMGDARANRYLATRLPDGRVLLTGGEDARGETLASADILDPATGEFEPVGDMTVPRVKHAAVPLPDGAILVIGGSDRRGFRARFASTEIFDPATGEFSPGPEMHAGRHKIRDAVVVLPSGDVLVAGGALRPEVLDPSSGVFAPVDGELAGPQMFATATRLRDGDVLVLGGYDERTRPSAAAWLIQPASAPAEGR